MNKKYNFTEIQDNLICTFIQLYHFNVSYGITRASQVTGIKRSLILNRYYRILRDNKKIFSFKFGGKEIWNTKRIITSDILNFKQYEPKPIISRFEELENRNWWNKKT